MHFIFVNVMGVGSLTGYAAEDRKVMCNRQSLPFPIYYMS